MLAYLNQPEYIFLICLLAFVLILFFKLIVKKSDLKNFLISSKKINILGIFSSAKIFEIGEKVKYNQLNIYTKKIDKNLIEATGIKLDKPIYIENLTNLNFNYAKNLWLAKKIYSFNLIIFYDDDQIKDKNLKCRAKSNFEILKNLFNLDAKFLNTNDLSKKIKENLYNLNINHNFDKKWHICEKNEIKPLGDFVKHTIFKNFCLDSTFENNNVLLRVKQTFFYGAYYFFETKSKNTNNENVKDAKKNPKSNRNKNVKIFFTKIIHCNELEYFQICKEKKYFKIEGLLNKKNYFFYSSNKVVKIEIIKILHSKNYCLKFIINLKQKLNEQNLKSNFWIYFGEKSPEKFFNFDYTELYYKILYCLESNFSIKLKSDNNNLNFYFNNYLPSKTITEGLENQTFLQKCSLNSILDNIYTESEFFNLLKELSFDDLINLHKSKRISAILAYNLIKNKLFIQKNNSFYINKNELANYELKFFIENKIKKIKIKTGDSKITIDGTTYHNCRNISIKTLINHQNFEAYL
ncbi:MAG: hypothetical protein PHV79_00480 [Clostridia bacterium]|jgi:hypothetical protein|nr:hypothetical protein [Clostridia bacterium]MDD3862321.1 hypothetical protein [Clostridia bacterium]